MRLALQVRNALTEIDTAAADDAQVRIQTGNFRLDRLRQLLKLSSFCICFILLSSFLSSRPSVSGTSTFINLKGSVHSCVSLNPLH